MITPLFVYAAISFVFGAFVIRILNTEFRKRIRRINDKKTMKGYKRFFGI